MKSILKYSILLVILFIGGCSKDEWMNPSPKTSLSDLSVFDTKDRIIAQVNGMYASLKHGQHLGGRFLVYNDIRDDNFIPNSNNGVTNYQTWNHTVINSTNEVQNLWGQIYTTINVVNVFLQGLTDAWYAGGKVTTFLSQAEYNQYRSEALAIRAICYFDLMQMYSKPYGINNGASQGVPLRLEANKSAAGNDLAPATVAEVYAQILSDLDEAEPMATLTFGDDESNIIRIHRNTIIAYKTRVYMHMRNWAKVVSESAKIVSSSAPFTAGTGVANALNSTYAGVFASPHSTSENIFSLPNTTADNPGTQNYLSHYFNNASGESYYLNTASAAFTALNATDARRTMMRTVSGKTYIQKYTDNANRTDYSPVIRYAEVLLNRAEAIVRQGNAVTQEAVDLLNAVRTRSYPAGAYTIASFADAEALNNAILLERNIEFLGEGIRNMDLMRLGLTIPGKDGGSMGNIAEIPSTSPTYYWPVPASELSYNKLMTPNN
ncbi:MAG TPA: RagB/SusD family nutrient uptake outer membrane protein [Bacteroidales bacterium]|nr:RagB/SusD family nutrient uptake outer membrane protein [Bacteroidales bacterium]